MAELKLDGKQWIALIALTAAGFGVNYYLSYEIFFSVRFVFGSVFALLALQAFGLVPGVLSAFLISTATYALWGHPYNVAIMTSEVLVTGLILRRGRLELVLANALYWCIIGMPLAALFHWGLMRHPLETTTVIMLKDALNGITNALMARLLFMAVASRSRRQPVSFREIIFNLLALFVLVPALFLIALQSRVERDEIDRRVRDGLILTSEKTTMNLAHWLEDDLSRVSRIASLAASQPLSRMQQIIDQTMEMDDEYVRLALLDKDATTIAFSPLVDESGHSNLGRNYADRPFVPILKRDLKPMLSEVVMGRVDTPKPAVSALAPVLSGGRYNGYVIGVLDMSKVEGILALNTKTVSLPESTYVLMDKNAKVILSSRPGLKTMDTFVRDRGVQRLLEAGVFEWVPMGKRNVSASDRWRSAVYFKETDIGGPSGWRLVMEQPIAPIQSLMYSKYTLRLGVVFSILMGALILASLLSRTTTRPLESLGVISSGLPAKLSTREEILWDSSDIVEIQRIVDNFREMTVALRGQFEHLEDNVKERTRELKESEEKFRLLAENTSDVVWQLDLRTNRYSYMSPSTLTLTGFTAAETIEMSVEDSLSPESFRETQVWLERAVREFAAGRTERRGDNRQIELIHKRGGTVWAEISTTYLLDSSNRPIALNGISRDITERKRMEKTLKQSEEKFRTLFESADDGIIIISPDGRFLDMNTVAHERLGYTKEEMLGLHITDIDSPEFAKLVPERIAIIRAVGKATFEAAHVRKDGTVMPVEASVRMVELGGERVLLSIARDITERKRMENELRKTITERETLLRELYHRTKNNMNVIISLINLQASSLAHEGNFVQMFRDLQSRIMSMSLVHEMLYRSKDLSHVKLNDYVNDLTKALLVAYKTRRNAVDLRLDIGDFALSIDTLIPCGLIINELMTNSLKYAFTDGRHGEIGISGRMSPEGEIELVYRDNGVGFPEGFDPKANRTLGLKLIRGLMSSQLRGTVDISGSPEPVFSFRFREPDYKQRI